jgi:predicted DNA-binding transcriptional regulator
MTEKYMNKIHTMTIVGIVLGALTLVMNSIIVYNYIIER